VLGVYVDPDEVRVQVRRGNGQSAVPLTRNVVEGLGAVFSDGAAEAFCPMDQFVESGTDRPGGGDMPDLSLSTRRR
jgi:hypothetical protein